MAGHQGVFGKMATSRPRTREQAPDEYEGAVTALASRGPTGEEDREAESGVYALFPGGVATLQRDALIEDESDDEEQADADEISSPAQRCSTLLLSSQTSPATMWMRKTLASLERCGKTAW
jgi:hypothetical protein